MVACSGGPAPPDAGISTAVRSAVDRGAATDPPGVPDRADESAAAAEYQDRLFQCFRENGVEVDASGDKPEIFADGDQLQAVIATCEELLGPMPPPASLTDTEIAQLYEESLAAKACLEDEGFVISEPPSFEVFLETYRLSFNGGPPPWYPHAEVDSAAASELCPQPALQ